MKYEEVIKKVNRIKELEEHLKTVKYANILCYTNIELLSHFIPTPPADILKQYRDNIGKEINNLKIEIEGGNVITPMNILENSDWMSGKNSISSDDIPTGVN